MSPVPTDMELRVELWRLAQDLARIVAWHADQAHGLVDDRQGKPPVPVMDELVRRARALGLSTRYPGIEEWR